MTKQEPEGFADGCLGIVRTVVSGSLDHDIAGQVDVERRILVVPWDEELTLHGPF